MSIERVILKILRNSVRASERNRRTREREKLNRERNLEYLAAQQKRESIINYLDSRLAEVDDLNTNTHSRLDYLNNEILQDMMFTSESFSFQELKPIYSPPQISSRKSYMYEKSEIRQFFYALESLPIVGKCANKARLITEIKIAKERILENRKIRKENTELNEYNINYRAKVNEIQNLEIQHEELKSHAVATYITETLKKTSHKIDWDPEYEAEYNETSKEAIVNILLPTQNIVPSKTSYKYIKSRDEITSKIRKKSETEEDYKKLICNIVLGVIFRVFDSDEPLAIDTITVNGYVKTIDKSTGRKIKPCILSTCTTKDEFSTINLINVDPIACIRGLKSTISVSPNEYLPVHPIRQILKQDKRFVEERDILSTIDNRPNLMELDPFEFENLIANLFNKMGFETKQTRSSRDGGVDAIVYDTRELVGGKIVIQAKRYKNTVGVAAVRELYGTLINEGAKKGILVSTSGHGKDAFDFIKDKPITLIDGSNLIYLLDQIDIKAKIVIPEKI